MQSLKRLNPLKLAKRNGQSYESLPVHETDARKRNWTKAEKSDDEELDYDSEYSSTSLPESSSSSRHTSGSHNSGRPMLGEKKSAAALAREASYKMPRRVVQGFCWSMILLLIGFILFLVRMSHVSARSLRDHRPAPVPQWESFDFLTRYYGGLKTLVPKIDNIPEYPLPEDEGLTNGTASPIREDKIHEILPSKPWEAYSELNSSLYLNEYASAQECFLDSANTFRVPSLQYYEGLPSGFPDNIIGSYDVFGMRSDVCFDRYGKQGPYGYNYGLQGDSTNAGQNNDKTGDDPVRTSNGEVDYSKLDWANAQQRCFEANKARFHDRPRSQSVSLTRKDGALSQRDGNSTTASTLESAVVKSTKKTLPRTAVVVRTWDSFKYHEEDIMYLRALIAELALGSGGEYDVHLLVQVKNETAPVWADQNAYDAHLKDVVPEEFWGISTLWSESQNVMLYPGLEETWARGEGLPVHGVYRGLLMAMQYFAMNNPQYDFFWQWEMDVRYTGHYYSLFKQLNSWTTSQPRKGLWERNGRFYIPSIHGTWEDFVHMVRVQSEQGSESASSVWSGVSSLKSPTTGAKADAPIWGPERPGPSDQFEIDDDPKPTTSYTKDKYTWGVGEAADLITLNPIFDPEGTSWGLAKDVTGYDRDGADGLPPRRAAIITASRMSRKLLTTMHRETAFAKHHAFSEMWPATVALQHGYKAVYAPHPVYIDREWPVPYLAAVMNAGKNGASGGSRTSVFGEREHNFKGTTWYYNSGFAGNLWRRWLGLRVDNEGGEEFESKGRLVEDGVKGVPGMRGGEGRMCLPPMLLHPVKGVELPTEGHANDPQM